MKYVFLALIILAACGPSASEQLAEQLVSDTDFSYKPIETNEEKIPAIEQIQVPAVQIVQNDTPEENVSAANETPQEIIITQTEIQELQVNKTEEPINKSGIQINETLYSVSNFSANTSEKRPPLHYFFNLFNEKIKSYQFVYKGNKYFVKGTKYRILLWKPTVVQNAKWANGTSRNAFYYDTIYIDRVQKKAKAYCEGHKSEVNKKCAELDLYELEYELSFDEHSILLPEDWLYSYLNREAFLFEENKYELGSRSTIMFAFNDSFTTELNFDQKTGLVVRADQKLDTKLLTRYDYEDLAINTVRDVDVIHRKKDEIPASEAFYKIV